MAKMALIAVTSLVVLLLVGGVVLYAYDASHEDRVAEGVTVAGVDVGGLEAADARRRIEQMVAAPLRQPVTVTHRGRRFVLSARKARVRADVGGMVDEAVRKSREGSFLGRAVRDLGGSSEDVQVATRVSYSEQAAARLVDRVRKTVDRPAKDAEVEFPSLAEVKEQDGIQVRAAKLKAAVTAAITDNDDRDVQVPTEVVKPKVTRAQLADKYPAVVVVERGSFKLRLYKRLQLAREYPIAVGQVGLETPAGLYNVQNKAVDPAWSVPNSDWAGSLAGTVVPGGTAENPLKERWMGIYDGAGIHGTDDTGSLGSAASHGCIRMAIPDVIALYDEVDVGTPVYIS